MPSVRELPLRSSRHARRGASSSSEAREDGVRHVRRPGDRGVVDDISSISDRRDGIRSFQPRRSSARARGRAASAARRAAPRRAAPPPPSAAAGPRAAASCGRPRGCRRGRRGGRPPRARARRAARGSARRWWRGAGRSVSTVESSGRRRRRWRLPFAAPGSGGGARRRTRRPRPARAAPRTLGRGRAAPRTARRDARLRDPFGCTSSHDEKPERCASSPAVPRGAPVGADTTTSARRSRCPSTFCCRPCISEVARRTSAAYASSSA